MTYGCVALCKWYKAHLKTFLCVFRQNKERYGVLAYESPRGLNKLVEQGTSA